MPVPLDSLLQISSGPIPRASLHLRFVAAPPRLVVEDASLPEHILSPHDGLWAAVKTAEPYHPLYFAAILTAGSRPLDADGIGAIPIPTIAFATEPSVRTSMTLNGMRMATEFAANGSNRLFDLVDNRLAEGQTDIVHDILVYAVRQVLDVRREMLDAASRRTENVAAYLGLDPQRVLALLAAEMDAPVLSVDSRLVRRLAAGEAGPPRPNIEIGALARAQTRRLFNELRPLRHREATMQVLLEAIAASLYAAQA